MKRKSQYTGLHLWAVRISLVGLGGVIALQFLTTSRDPSSALVKLDAWVPGSDYSADEIEGVASVTYEGTIDG